MKSIGNEFRYKVDFTKITLKELQVFLITSHSERI